MKTCRYCGQQNTEEESESCSQCGTSFEDDRESPPQLSFTGWFNRPVSSRLKAYFCFAAWVGVFLVSLPIDPAYALAVPLFPVGLVGVLPNGAYFAVIGSMLVIPAIMGWSIYFFLHLLIKRAGKAGTFVLVYIVLCTVLMLNVVGCQRVIEATKGIH